MTSISGEELRNLKKGVYLAHMKAKGSKSCLVVCYSWCCLWLAEFEFALNKKEREE